MADTREEKLAAVVRTALHTGVCPDDGETCCWGGEDAESDKCAENDLSALARHVAAALVAALDSTPDPARSPFGPLDEHGHDGHASRLNGLLADCPGCATPDPVVAALDEVERRIAASAGTEGRAARFGLRAVRDVRAEYTTEANNGEG